MLTMVSDTKIIIKNISAAESIRELASMDQPTQHQGQQSSTSSHLVAKPTRNQQAGTKLAKTV